MRPPAGSSRSAATPRCHLAPSSSISTQAGAFPPGLMTNIFRGFDVAILVTAPMLLGASPVWSLAIAAIAAAVLLNSMDAESVRARQAEQRKEL